MFFLLPLTQFSFHLNLFLLLLPFHLLLLPMLSAIVPLEIHDLELLHLLLLFEVFVLNYKFLLFFSQFFKFDVLVHMLLKLLSRVETKISLQLLLDLKVVFVASSVPN